jgi:hypothetical protein
MVDLMVDLLKTTLLGTKAAGALIQFHITPFVAVDSLANLRCIFAFLMHLADKENLLETNLSGGAVVIYMTMQEALVSKPRIAITVTGLLRQHFRDVFR